MPGQSHLSYLPSFQSMRGAGLVDATDLNRFFNMTLGSQSGLVAKAGGGIPGATVANFGFNSFTTVATAADSAMLPPATINGWCWIINGGANSMSIYNVQSNYNNGSTTDVIVPHGSAAPNAGNAAITLATGHATLFICIGVGAWKQVADFA